MLHQWDEAGTEMLEHALSIVNIMDEAAEAEQRLKAELSSTVTEEVQELTRRLVPPSERESEEAGITAPPDIILDEVATLRAYNRYSRFYRPPVYSPDDEALVRQLISRWQNLRCRYNRSRPNSP